MEADDTPKITKGTSSTPTTRAGRAAKAGKPVVQKDGTVKKARSTGSYSVSGKKVTILQTQDKHKLWADLFSITESQIRQLKEKTEIGGELDPKEMSKLDSCFNGMKKLIEIEAQLKSDAIAAMSTEELIAVAKKSIREATSKKKTKSVVKGEV